MFSFTWFSKTNFFIHNYYNNDNKKMCIALSVFKIRCGVCVCTAMYNNCRWIGILCLIFCYYEQSVCISSPCPFQDFDVSVFLSPIRCHSTCRGRQVK